MTIKTIDGKIHHLKELAFIEKMLAETVIAPDEYYRALAKFLKDNHDLEKKVFWSARDLERLDKFTKDYFLDRIDEARVWLVRAYVVGRFLGESDIKAQIFKIDELSKLPKFVQDAAKKYGLTLEEAQALKIAVEEGAANMSNTTVNTIQTIRNALVESTKVHGNAGQVLKQLETMLLKRGGDVGELNRDWERVCIHETNKIFSDGYLSTLKEGEFVVGFSMPDACNYCKTEIQGQVYRVRKTPAPDYSQMKGEEKEKWMKVWETEVWVGKSNWGRSTSQRKRINPLIGNKESNLREKEHHEFSMPTVPAHTRCRCRWVRIDPKFQYVDKDGQIRMRVEDEDEWKEWYDELKQTYNLEKSLNRKIKLVL